MSWKCSIGEYENISTSGWNQLISYTNHVPSNSNWQASGNVRKKNYQLKKTPGTRFGSLSCMPLGESGEARTPLEQAGGVRVNSVAWGLICP